MKSKVFKTVATATACAMTIGSVGVCAIGCTIIPWGYDNTPTMTIGKLANTLGLSLMGDDAYSWNVLATDSRNFGYDRTGDAAWYSYQAVTANDISEIKSLFKAYKSELGKYDVSELSAKDMTTYRTLDYVVSTYYDYYSSRYAYDFSLIGGAFVNSEGGYVADFASAAENYTLRKESDVRDLIKITQSTADAFPTYAVYASDRARAGYPLYDATLDGMCEYLDDVYSKGDEYYLYGLVDRKIDAATFLSTAKKTEYKTAFAAALDNYFMPSVNNLSRSLSALKGRVTSTQVSYLGAAGAAGKEYYKWLFKNKTGMRIVDFESLYSELLTAYSEHYANVESITAEADALENTEPQTYADFYAYKRGEKPLLGMTDPQQILEYLKGVSTRIVPNLTTEPEIDFKYIDETVASRTNVLAYYLHSPLDDPDAPEHITLNPNLNDLNKTELVTTIAHEGYPGHLYASVKAKNTGLDFLTLLMSCPAFSEGWAKYVELALLDIIAADTSDKATELYCRYAIDNIQMRYISAVLSDLQINYFGYTVTDYAQSIPAAEASEMIEAYMEIPAQFVPYGYGMYRMASLHSYAKQALGNKYSEPELNGLLLSEGMGPTLARADEIARKYVSSKK